MMAEAMPVVRRLTRALVGLALVVAGPLLLAMTFDHPSLRSTGWPAWPPMLCGVVLALSAAAVDRRTRVRVIAALAVLGSAAFVWLFFVFARMPATTDFARLARAIDFTLPDQDENPIALADLRARGPVHIVFYRGFW